MARKRFKSSRICSSENYILSRRVHVQDLKRNHVSNVEYFQSLEKVPYIKVWGKEMRISKEMAETTFKNQVIWK